ncbi:MAG: Bug family tripartite tricarboxylate transporter substrate binding protein [Xanthobacteraceae bacterium]
MTKRLVLAGLAALLAAGSYGPAAAQFKPTKPIEVVVHSGPGAGNDVFGRAVIAALEKEKLIPVRMQIANRTGGGGTNAMNYVMSKSGDTHTLAVFTSLWTTNPLVQKAAKHKITDMTPISRLVIEPGVIVVRADSPYKTMKDLIEAARKNPGGLKQSGGSIMSRDNLVRQVLQNATKTRWIFVSFPSGGERIAQLLGGHVDLMVMEPSEAGELIRSGKLRALAQLSTKRVRGYEKVPTLKEAGFDVPEVPQSRGLVAPPKLPAAAVAYYETLFEKLSKSPSWKKVLADNLLEDAYLNSKATGAFLNENEKTMREIIKLAGIKLVR